MIEEVMVDQVPVDWKKQCQLDGNVSWNRHRLVLNGTPPQVVVRCTVYPGVFGDGLGSQIDVSIDHQWNGGEAIFRVNEKESRSSTKLLKDEAVLELIRLPIPLTSGILAGKAVEFVDYGLIFFLILGLIRHQLLNKRNQAAGKISWNSLFVLSFLCTYLYVFLEWLFIITKPSSLRLNSFATNFVVFLVTSAIFACLCFAILFFLFAVSSIHGLHKFRGIFLNLGRVIPVSIITAQVLLLIDNFTYTLLNWGIATSAGIFRSFYVFLVCSVFLFLYYKFGEISSWLVVRMENKTIGKIALPDIVAIILLSLLFSISRQSSFNQTEIQMDRADSSKLPDIILITGDGIDANHVSAYGYSQDTTPRIRELAETSLVAENAFTNAGNTAGSIISTYTGKYPTETRFLYPPDILKGEDSYQHLPGILRSVGYYNVEFTAPHYGDAFDANLLSGFDFANGRSAQNNVLTNLLSRYFQTNEVYFIYEISNRIMDRISHIFYISKMANNQALAQGTATKFDDQTKIDSVLDIIKNTERPVFAHIHWMGTHSVGILSDTVELDDTSNDENIHNFDTGIGQIIEYLTKNGLMNNTILIIGSDHCRMYLTINRIPLLMHFPNGQYANRVKSDTQNLDISPTILDYLGIEKPAWMKGESFLRGEPGNRVIFAVGVGKDVLKTDSWHANP